MRTSSGLVVAMAFGWWSTARAWVWVSIGLLDILGLFAEFFQLGFDGHDLARNLAVIGFGANGVDFPIHFLGEEIQHAANRLFGFEAIVGLLAMTLAAGQFFRDV